MKKIEKIIKTRLNMTNRCEFKKAFLPKGYAIVNINHFAKNVASLIKKELDKESKA